MAQLIPITTPDRVFEDRTQTIYAAADVPYSRRMVTSSEDRIVRLWDLKTGEVVKYMEGHTGEVMGLAVSRNGQMIATGDENGELIAWKTETGESLTNAVKVHGSAVRSLDFSPDDAFIVTASSAQNDQTVKFWNTKTWAQNGYYACGSTVRCVRYARSGERTLAVATDQDIQIYTGGTRQTKFKGHSHGTLSLAWSPDRRRLLSGGDDRDPSIREWNTSNWTQVGGPWMGHTYKVNSITVHSSGTYAVSASSDNTVRLWQLSDKQTIAIFQHASSVVCAAFSADGTHILSGGYDKRVAVWSAPKGTLALAVDASTELVSTLVSMNGSSDSQSQQSSSKVEQSVSVAEQSLSMTEQSLSKTEQSLSLAEQSVVKSEQSVAQSEQSVTMTEQSLSKAEQSLSSAEQSVVNSEQSVVQSEQSVTMSEQSVSASEQSVTKAEQSLSRAEQSLSLAEQSAVKSEQSVSASEQIVTKAEQSLSKTEQSLSLAEQSAVKSEQSVSSSEQSVPKAEQSLSLAEQSVTKSEQSVIVSEQSVSASDQSVTKVEQSLSRAEQSLSLAEQSVIKSQQSVTVSEQSVSASEQSITKAEQSLSKTEQSLSLAEQFVTKSEQSVFKAESKVEQAISKTLVITTAELLAITKTTRTASITGDLFTAEKVLTQEITANAKNFASYANRSFVMARKLDWDSALQDATKSLAIRSSLAGYIAKGIALCGKQLVEDARTAFDLAFTFTLGNMDATVFLYLIKAVALFNANRHKEAMLRVDLLAADPSVDPLACGVVVASLRVQLGTAAFNGAHHSEAIEHFTAAVKASTFFAKSAPPAACEAFTVLFGWDIGTLWQTSNKKLILALLGAGRLGEAFESYRFAMDASNATTKTSLHSWILTLSL